MTATQDATARSFPSHTDWLLLAGFCGFFFFFGLSYFGLVGADEPRYAQVAREMLARHDWITPTLGGQPWLEKPALYYWQAMLAYSFFGVSDWAARLPSAVDATLMVVAVYLFLRRFRPGFHLDGALMTASAAGIVGFARAAAMDMPLAATFTVAMLAWYAWHEGGSKAHLALFYMFLALGALSKGPVAPVLAALIIALFAWAKGEKRLCWKTLWIPGILLFCAVALPWYIAVEVQNPEFFRVFILQHNLARFGTDLYHHTEPFWYYVPVVLLGLLPWVVFVAAAMVETARAWWTAKREVLQEEDALNVFLLIWFFVPMVFFSISQSKLPGYILLLLPAGTLLAAEYARRHASDDDRPALGLIVVHSFVAVLPVVPALMIQYLVLQHHLPWNKATAASAALALALAAGIALTLRARHGLRLLRFVTLVPGLVVIAAVLRIGASTLDSQLSARPLAEEISRMENGHLPLAVLRTTQATEFGLQFYRNQNIPRYELGQIPAVEHVVVAREGLRKRVEQRAAGRKVSYLGSFPAQHLEYFWVAAANGR